MDGHICRHGHIANGILCVDFVFAEFNVPKFKQISGSLRNAFGVQKVVPLSNSPKHNGPVSEFLAVTQQISDK